MIGKGDLALISRKGSRWLGLMIGLLVIVGADYRSKAGQDLSIRTLRADPTSPQLVTLGEQVYARECASCHGVNLEGQPNWRLAKPDGRLPAPPHDDSGHTWHHDDQTLFALTKFGVAKFTGMDIESDMPAYEGKLTDREIVAVLAFIKSRWSVRTRRRQEQINARTGAQ